MARVSLFGIAAREIAIESVTLVTLSGINYAAQCSFENSTWKFSQTSYFEKKYRVTQKDAYPYFVR